MWLFHHRDRLMHLIDETPSPRPKGDACLWKYHTWLLITMIDIFFVFYFGIFYCYFLFNFCLKLRFCIYLLSNYYCSYNSLKCYL